MIGIVVGGTVYLCVCMSVCPHLLLYVVPGSVTAILSFWSWLPLSSFLPPFLEAAPLFLIPISRLDSQHKGLHFSWKTSFLLHYIFRKLFSVVRQSDFSSSYTSLTALRQFLSHVEWVLCILVVVRCLCDLIVFQRSRVSFHIRDKPGPHCFGTCIFISEQNT